MSVTLAAPFSSTDRTSALIYLTGEFPSWRNLFGVPPAPLAVRCDGASDARSSTRVHALVLG